MALDIRALADSEPGDVIDESCGNSTKEVMFTSYTESRKQLHKIEAALERIDSGEFGICAVCEGRMATPNGRDAWVWARALPSRGHVHRPPSATERG